MVKFNFAVGELICEKYKDFRNLPAAKSPKTSNDKKKTILNLYLKKILILELKVDKLSAVKNSDD